MAATWSGYCVIERLLKRLYRRRQTQCRPAITLILSLNRAIRIKLCRLVGKTFHLPECGIYKSDLRSYHRLKKRMNNILDKTIRSLWRRNFDFSSNAENSHFYDLSTFSMWVKLELKCRRSLIMVSCVCVHISMRWRNKMPIILFTRWPDFMSISDFTLVLKGWIMNRLLCH